MLILILVALYCVLHADSITLQVNDMHLVDTLQILIGRPMYNKESRPTQVAKMNGKVEFS